MSDLSGVVNEQKATIEALLRRVAELEREIEHYDTAEYHLSQMVKSLEAQLAARNQAAEAMGVLERLVKQPESIVELEEQGEDKFHVIIIDMEEREVKSISEGNNLIEAVLMAGGEDAQA